MSIEWTWWNELVERSYLWMSEKDEMKRDELFGCHMLAVGRDNSV